MNFLPQGTGWIEVICGPMFSGKTEELIRRMKRALIARQRVQAFKPRIDDRYSATEIASHEQRKLSARCVADVEELRSAIHDDVEVVGIDEVQFFGDDIVDLCEELADRGVRVIVAGLDQDFRALPFGPVPSLLARAEFVSKNLAICVLCGSPANRSHRTHGGESVIEVGTAQTYQALCRVCYRKERDAAEALASQRELPLET